MGHKTTHIFTRVDDELLARIDQEAKIRYSDNKSMVLRAALELYLDLRASLGNRYEIVTSSLTTQSREHAA